MKYSMTYLEQQYDNLVSHLFSDSSVEQAAYLLCGVSQNEWETRFIVRDVLPIPCEELLEQTWDRLSIPSKSFVPVLQRAAETKHCLFLVHSHPNKYPTFSQYDDEEEQAFFKTAYVRAENGIHGSLVFNSPNSLFGRIWVEEHSGLSTQPLSLIRILGKDYKFITTNNAPPDEPVIPAAFFDRQVRAFGKDLQALLASMHIGVVGCGGTGSATIEQLIRLGVGRLTIVDHDFISDTNITRVHGSGMKDYENNLKKTDVMKIMGEEIGLGTVINGIDKKLIYRSVAEELKNCDLIFGCTDDHAGRSILNSLSIYYCVPIIDMGVLIDSSQGIIHNILGRVTIVKPYGPCMLCRNNINAARVAAEIMTPEEHDRLRKEGYAPELDIKDPAVITFTTAVASQAVIEMLNMLTGFMGDDESLGEIVFRFDSRKISIRDNSNSTHCMCTDARKIGRADTRDFLGMSWPPEPVQEG